jgi:hypothetical protein
MFRAGKRIALYLPFDRETDTAALVAAARRRGVRIFVPVIVDRRHARIRFYPLDRRTRSGTFGISVPSKLTRPVSPRWLDLIVIPLVGVDTGGGAWGWAADSMIGRWSSAAAAGAGRGRAWSGSHSIVSAPSRGSPTPGT